MEILEELIEKNKKVKFKCEAAGGKGGEFVADTYSELNPPSHKEIDSIKTKLSGVRDDLLIFYEKHNGAEFHIEQKGGASGLLLHSISSWGETTAMMMEWYEMMDEDVLDEIDTDWLEDCITFAEVPCSGNYFVLVLNGNDEGKIIYTDHEVAEPEVYAKSFDEFLNRYLSNPAKEMYRLGCFTRYSDGKTNTQWIPKEVIAP